MSFLALRDIRKTFGDVVAIDTFDLDVERGEFVVLVGPSGCGKTTVLRIVAGLESPTSGTLELAGADITALSPRERDVAMVFQNYALYPHMTVRKNLAFGLRMRRVARDEIDRRVAEVARTLAIEGLLDRYPSQLSGGQRQRVALGRAIVREPKLFLMDEPLSNLDAELRVATRAELIRLHERLGVTTLYVTHDQVEAMTLGDRLVVLNAGRVEQIGTPAEVYGRPRSLFVARFLGSPPINVLEATASPDAGGCTVAVGERRATLGEAAAARLSRGTAGGDGERRVTVGLRPESIRIVGDIVRDIDGDIVADGAATAPGNGAAALRGTVDLVENLGKETIIFVRCSHPTIGEAIIEAIGPADFAGVKGAGVALDFDAEHLHFFDPASGLSLTSP